MRNGGTVDVADAAVAVRIADRELERLARMDRPLAIRLWRGWSLFVIVVVLVGAVTRFAEGRWLYGLWLLFVGFMIGYSLVRGRRRLHHQRAVLARSREANTALLATHDAGPPAAG